MSRKLGDVVIVIAILAFIVAGFGYIISNIDTNLGVSSGIIGSNLQTVKDNISNDVNFLGESLTTKTDETADYEPDPNAQIETRNSESSGIMNILSKNILINFILLTSQKLQIPTIVTGFIIFLITAIISILTIRFFWGDGRI